MEINEMNQIKLLEVYKKFALKREKRVERL